MKKRKQRYTIFVRTWWVHDSDGNLVHEAGRATTIGSADTERSARRICAEWNSKNDPGPLSRKAEYTEGIA